jgi:hypothetical protein
VLARADGGYIRPYRLREGGLGDYPVSIRKFEAGITKQFPGKASTFLALLTIWNRGMFNFLLGNTTLVYPVILSEKI